MQPSIFQAESDFWWLTPIQAKKYKYCAMWHQEPYSDEPNSNRTPTLVPSFSSLDSAGDLSCVFKRYSLNFIGKWREKCCNVNVFRSLAIFSDEQNGEELCGPFVMDVDREKDDESGKGSVPNIEEALRATRLLIQEYLRSLSDSDFRIFFTGHKGFNIEARPEALGIGSAKSWRQKFREIKGLFGNDFIDPYHKYLRLHNSINRWISSDGKVKNRMKFELTILDINRLTADQICLKSEGLASDYLKDA